MTETHDGFRPWRLLLALALGVLTVFFAGATAGSYSALNENSEPTLRGIAIVVGFALATVLSGWSTYHFGRFTLPRGGAKTRRALWMLILALAIGVMLAVLVPMEEDFTIFVGGGQASNWPLWRTILGLFVLIVIVPVITVIWHRNIDELVHRAYSDAALVAGYGYILISASWWLAWRGGLMPEPNGYILFWMFVAVWSVTGLWRHFR